MSKHTPTPWNFGTTAPHQRIILGGDNRRYICNVQIHQTPRANGLLDEDEREANAAFIVRACNAHDELLAVCKEIEDASVYWSEYDVPLGILHRLRAAIANAEGA